MIGDMSVPVPIAYEHVACEALLTRQILRPAIRQAMEQGELIGIDEEGRPLREVRATIEELQELVSMFSSLLLSRRPPTDYREAGACHRALLDTCNLLRSLVRSN